MHFPLGDVRALRAEPGGGGVIRYRYILNSVDVFTHAVNTPAHVYIYIHDESSTSVRARVITANYAIESTFNLWTRAN